MKKKISFFNIHNYTHYSILNSTIKIEDLILKSLKYKMKAIGIIDNNMMGTYNFITTIKKFEKKIKGIVGCEFFFKNSKNKKFSYILIAKNKIGYYNLIKLCSIQNLNNTKYIKKYKKGLIFLTGTLKSKIAYYIIKNKKKKAENFLLYWKKIFKNDFFIELFLNKLKNQKKVNNFLFKKSKKYKILYIIQNLTFFLKKKDYFLHNVLLCIKNKESIFSPINYEKKKGYRYSLPNNSFYFKKNIKIKKKYLEGIYNLDYLRKKIEKIEFKKKNFLPNKFEIPKKFILKNKKEKKEKINFLYLKYLTYKGAKKKYGKLNKVIRKRIKKELNLIKFKKFSNYFLIVKDIIDSAKKLDIYVGPGRGSVAGSIISYSLNITRIDPLKYNLLFERFLNKYRKKMPDIDLDLDYRKRKKLIFYLIKKYGKNKVCHIITYGKIGEKSAIRDCCRIFNISLKIVNQLCKFLNKKNKLKNVLKKKINILNKEKKKKFNDFKRKYLKKNSFLLFILYLALKIKGTIRNKGIHACGIIISNSNLRNYIPLKFFSKDKYPEEYKKKILLSQFDALNIEDLGLLKIDLLGLRTLTVIKETKKKIKKKKKKFTLKDKKTFELFKTSQTIGVFQYEASGIKIIISKFKPNVFLDLIAFNALYRPGPIKYIPNYIMRKNGKEKIEYDLPIMEKYLKETYGITIYQEQVILLAKKISGIDENEADLLREAIAKKNKKALKILKKKFFEKSLKKGYLLSILKKIWKDWESFASYAFNKSHSTCYAYLSYKTAFLKQYYKKEYLTSILNNNIENFKKQRRLLLETKRLNIKILPPDINLSEKYFTIEKKNIRYGLIGIKGIGEKATINIIKCRNKKKFTSILDFLFRINLRIITKRSIQILINSGSFDSLGISKTKLLFKPKNQNISKIEIVIKELAKYKKENKKIDYIEIKKKYKNYFYEEETDKNIYLNLKEQKKIIGINLNKEPFYLEKILFNIKNISDFKFNVLFGKEVLIKGFFSKIEKYNNIYYINLFEFNFFNKIIYQKFFLNKKKYKKFKKKLKNNKDNLIILKYDLIKKKIKNIYIMRKFHKYYKKILFVINIKNSYNLYILIIKQIIKKIKLENKKEKKFKKNIIFLVKDNKKKIYKKNFSNFEISYKILYYIKIKYPNIKIIFSK